MHNFRELKIWQKSRLLVKDVYSILTMFPETEKYGLVSQMKRCAISIPSNIAEGTSRKSVKDFSHFLSVSLGSCYELETQLILANDLKLLSDGDFNDLQNKVDELQKMIIGLRNKLMSNETQVSDLKSNI